MSILSRNQCDFFSIIRSLITKLLQPRKETKLQQFFSKDHDPKNVTPSVQGKHIYFALKGN